MRAVCFRCDENAATGLGHFARCRDLAQLLRRALPGLHVVLAGDLSVLGREQARAHGFEHFVMAPDEALLPERLRSALGAEARVLVDSYRLDAVALSELAGCGAVWGVFDDFEAFDYAQASLVINGRVSARASAYRAAVVLAGAEYFPATPELERARAERQAPASEAEPRQVLVFIGGHDRSGVGPQLARAVTEAFGAARVVLVQAAPLTAPSERIQHLPLGPGLEPLLAASDLIVAGGGRLKYEACYCLAPCASVSQTAGQAEDTAQLAQQGLCVDLGLAERFEPARIVTELRELWRPDLLAAMRAAQAHAFPADAPERLARAVLAALSLA
jgi:spore coat polysaccharide biosynthesis predicted glycosyltransferase SpsG